MKKQAWKRVKTIFVYALVMMMAVTFMPCGISSVHAASFSTGGSVSGLKVTATDTHAITLAWNGYSKASGYQVYRALSSNGTYENVKTLSATSLTRTGLTTGKTCYYKVRAYAKDSSGKTIYSKFSSVVTGTPAPINTAGTVKDFKVATYDDHSVTLAWSAYDRANGYQIYRALTNGGKYELVKDLNALSFKRTGLTTNKTCYYKVRAYYKGTDGKVYYTAFTPVVAGTPVGFNVAGTVAGFKLASKTYNSVTFAWNPYPMTAGYQIYRAKSSNGKYELVNTTSATTITRTGLTTNTKCYYKIRAYAKDSRGKTVYSKFSSVITGTPNLQVPTVSVSSASDGITVSWNAIPGAKGYKVYRATSKNGKYSEVKNTTGRSFKNTSIDKDKGYYYKVRAYRTIKKKDKHSGYSTPLLGMKTSVSQVKGVTATSTSNGIQLGWTKTGGASGYEIYRASNSASASYSCVGTAGSNSFKDVNVANGVTYFYKVRAYKKVGNSKVYGSFNKQGYSRSTVVSTAAAWLGCKESNASNKPIIDLYNSNMGTKFSYKDAWCAMYVSAVAIKSGTTSIIVRGSYCPTVINTYKNSKVSNYKYAAGPKYTPKAGDVIFFDWNKNGVPDHTGLVASVSGSTVKTIEGNYSDAVGYRTFSVGYSYVQGYGLPNYDEACGILYTGQTNTSVGCGELAAMGIGTEPEGYDALGTEYDFVEQKVEDNVGCAEDVSDYDKMVYMVKKVRQNAESESADCSTSQYYAAFIYKLCQEAGIDASIITAEDEAGNVNAWIEVSLDGKWYRVDASQQTDQIVEFTPEITDIEG